MADSKSRRVLGTLKIIGAVLGALAAIYAIAILAVAGNSAWNNYQQKRAVAKWQAELEKPYREDVYGGQTPEETWGMFLDALRQGDIELASKYFAVGKQDEYKQDLKKAKQGKRLNKWVKEMEGLEKDNDPKPSKGEAYYSYRYYDKEFNKALWSSVIFYFNPSTKVWKILVL